MSEILSEEILRRATYTLKTATARRMSAQAQRLEAENAELKRLIKWIDNNQQADRPFATINLREWEKQKQKAHV